MEIAQQIGLAFIILLMLFAIRNDVMRYFFP
jgi:membrane-associated protease RseP (regulator of RpoE activity)